MLSSVCFASSQNTKSTLTITKQDILVVTAHILRLAPVDGETTFADDDDIALWAKGYIKALQQSDYIDGDFHNNILPNKEMSIDDILTFIKGTVDKSKATVSGTVTPSTTHKLGGGTGSSGTKTSNSKTDSTNPPKDNDNIGEDIF